MKEFIEQNGGLIATVALVMVSVNLFLSGLAVALEKIMDKTEWKGDNKLHAFIIKVLAISGAALDWLSSNRAHK